MRVESHGQPQEGQHDMPPPQHGGLVTLLFRDVVGSTALKQRLGDLPAIELIQQHHELLRGILRHVPGAEEISTAGDSFLILFSTPSDAVRFALRLQSELREFNRGRAEPVEDRVGLHMREVVVEDVTADKRTEARTQ